MATAFRELAAGLRFPEGPVAMRDGSVILVEIEGRRLTRIEPEGKRIDHCHVRRLPQRRRDRS